jgi:polysaccharide pyruvyl transferase WcaK-like protein
MKRAALHGAYTTNNFGDVLLMQIFARWMREAGAERLVMPLAPEKNVRAVGADESGWGPLLNSQAMIYGGGGYFGEPPKQPYRWAARNFRLHAAVGLAATAKRIPLGIIGTGAGPISAGFLRQTVAAIAQRAEVVLVRDEESGDFMRKIGVKHAEVSADAALTLGPGDLSPEGLDYARGVLLGLGGRKTLVLHLQAPRGHAEGQRAIAEGAARFLEANPDWGALIVNDSGKIRLGAEARVESDYLAMSLSSRFPESVRVVPYQDEPAQLTALLGSVDAVITTKLHVGIVATALGRSVISFPQHTKTVRLFRQLRASERCLPLDEATTEVAEERIRAFAKQPLAVPVEVRDAAERNREAVLRLIHR